MVERNIMIQKTGGNSGKTSVGYKVSLPAQMVRDLGVTLEDRAVQVEYKDNQIIITKA